MFEQNMMPDVVRPSMDATVGFPGPFVVHFGLAMLSTLVLPWPNLLLHCVILRDQSVQSDSLPPVLSMNIPYLSWSFLHISLKFPGHFCPQHGIF